MVTKDKKWWTFEVLGPSMIYNRFNREISCHHITVSLHHRITASLSVSHLPCPLPPNQSVICLAPCHQTSQSFALPSTTTSPHHHITVLVSHLPCPCHQTSQSFALPPATKPVSHLPCPLPLHHRVTTSLRHRISQSFAFPPATKPVSHLPCPLPPNQSVICLAPYHHVTASSRHRATVSLHHCITASPRHRIS